YIILVLLDNVNSGVSFLVRLYTFLQTTLNQYFAIFISYKRNSVNLYKVILLNKNL
mgnify:CR=1